ncbi:hypothetical protein PSAL_018730 [Pseudooceanicola algae]|uniref:Uncharacterized protein n=1 Tax=Pseudooceanicola algae TaxID=1537215 RepID=A0A418SJQ1_9RHOB|nr:xanthine dehydrogenase accessory protein XdhC [Pseudooceanicola algae]QPM90634.1 hypothetical protein PSAL_018730 [Pseudooceanicola algae]
MFDRDALADALTRAPRVVRVVVASARGSVPRGAGTAMIVGPDFLIGTIGGGTLEHEAMGRARGLVTDLLEKRALGPDLGQCCGGAVSLLYEIYDAARLATLPETVIARPLPGGSDAMPFAVKRVLAGARGAGDLPHPGIIAGWMVESVLRPTRQIWVWGAGHVGRAVVSVLAPLPGFALTWVDTGAERFPASVPAGVTALPAADPVVLAQHAPPQAEHLILTYSHSLDLALCDALLTRGFSACGLIGSASKWVRFQRRLRDLGHAPARIARISCPIGDPSIGKHPQEIAVSVAAEILGRQAHQDAIREREA